MKKFLIVLVYLLSISLLFAKTYKVVNVSGTCLYKQDGIWKDIRIEQTIDDETEINIGVNSLLVLNDDIIIGALRKGKLKSFIPAKKTVALSNKTKTNDIANSKTQNVKKDLEHNE